MSQNVQIIDGKVVFTKKESVVGTRVCPQCGVSEKETLAKNPRYSFCTITVAHTEHAAENGTVGQKLMGCIYCYNKNRAKVGSKKELSREDIVSQIEYYKNLLKMLDAASK